MQSSRGSTISGNLSLEIGQRVLAQNEPELGLGLVVAIQGKNRVEVLFSAAGVVRQYAVHSAPLQRFVLRVGQKAVNKTGDSFQISKVELSQNLYCYHGTEGQSVWEYELHHQLEDLGALNQFLLGRWSQFRSYDLRLNGWQLRSQSLDPDIRGLVGARVGLLPHQLYVARQVAGREIPRVLLGDEVGLGKTIEAGLVYCSLRSLGRANRVLILVPDHLKFQWLAELYRRFGEMFSILDEDRSEQEEASQASSPFVTNQRIICSIDFLLENPERLKQAAEIAWDLLILDEAHHLQWDEAEPSDAWVTAKILADRAHGMLLLTATPRQRGLETQFGLLHLVDPQRFADFQAFKTEMEEIRGTAELAQRVWKSEGADTAALTALKKKFPGDSEIKNSLALVKEPGGLDKVLGALVDRHGTGRVFVRNRRERLGGFPKRVLAAYPLKASEATSLQWNATDPKEHKPPMLLALAGGQRTAKQGFEERGRWLLDLLGKLGKEKALLLCSSPRRVMELDDFLRTQSAVRRALFHEDMDLVERDRQAAWFAQPDGAQLLICSEIGGEGRNFQFAHELILWDLPSHPDLLEQRIGRLDRIGQRSQFNIHVPYVEDTMEEVLFRWYHEGLGSFESVWNGGPGIVETMQDQLVETLRAYLPKSKQHGAREKQVKALIVATREMYERVRGDYQSSVDALVDYNSFSVTGGKSLKEKISQIDETQDLRRYMDSVFDYFGVQNERIDEQGIIRLNAHALTFVDNFPELPHDEDKLVTYRREVALAREEISFLTQDHPMVQGALSLLLDRNEGRASVCRWANHTLDRDGIIMQLSFVLEANGPAALETQRYLPLQAIEIFADSSGKILDRTKLGLNTAHLAPLPDAKVRPYLEELERVLPPIVDKASAWVRKQFEPVIARSLAGAKDRLAEEQLRLEQLRKTSGTVSAKEIKRHAEKQAWTLDALRDASVRLDALRLIWAG
jgi:ATP-dependent helicase HepA